MPGTVLGVESTMKALPCLNRIVFSHQEPDKYAGKIFLPEHVMILCRSVAGGKLKAKSTKPFP